MITMSWLKDIETYSYHGIHQDACDVVEEQNLGYMKIKIVPTHRDHACDSGTRVI